VLYEKHARYGELVKACSDDAMALGVRPTMPLAEAKALVIAEPTDKQNQRSGPVHDKPYFACHDALDDREALAKLAEWCEQFSPIVGLDQTDEPDCLLMDVTGLAKLFGGEEALARKVSEAFQGRGFAVRIVVANTVGTARAVARFGMQHDCLPCQIISPGDEQSLNELPVTALRLSVRTMEQLKRLGIKEIGQLNKLPRTSLATRFDDNLLKRLDQITGAGQEVIVSHKRTAELAAHWLFEHATTHPGAIEHVFRDLLQQLSRGLIDQGQGVLRLECRLVCKGHRPLVINVGLYQPTINSQHLLALVKVQLEQLILPDAVEEIRVAATLTAPKEQQQNELFASASRDDPSKLGLLVERLSSRLGRDRVVRAQLEAETQVELAYRCVPLTGGQPVELAGRSGSRQSESKGHRGKPPKDGATNGDQPASCPGLGPMLRPLRIFDPPQPIDVIGVALDGPPAMFHYQRTQHRVARYFGPERIETGWWRGPSSRRDYYRVETEAGNRMWLFRRLQDRKWFLQGEFE